MTKTLKARIFSWIKKKLGIVSPSEFHVKRYGEYYKTVDKIILATTGILITTLGDKVGD